MSIKDLLKELRKSNIDISLDGENIALNSDIPEIPSGIIEKIKANKIAIIDYLKKELSAHASFSPIAVLESQPSYSLSSSQKRMWILNQLDQSSPAYNMPGVYRFSGKIDIEKLEASFLELISRHEILRTVFKEDAQGQLCQYIQSVSEQGFKLNYVDYSTLPNLEEKVRSHAQQNIEKSFDLSCGPLLRAGLIQTGKDEYVFNYVMHHIISDGWSMGILIKELLLIYNAKINGDPFPLQALRFQYKDYASWQLKSLGEDKAMQSKRYWLKQFEDEIPLLELATDSSRGSVKSYNGKTYQKILSRDQTISIKNIINQEGCTLFMGVLGLINVLLYKYTSQSDIVIGSPVLGRDNIELEDQIGFYANTLAIRNKFSGKESYKDLLNNIKSNMLSAYEHQMYPFDELVSELDIPRDMSRNPLFDIMLVLLSDEVSGAKPQGQTLGNLEISSYDNLQNVSSKFDLTFTFSEVEKAISLTIEYNSDLFETKMIERLAMHLDSLLTNIILHPEESLDCLDYLTDQEKIIQLKDFNNTLLDYPKDKTLVELFEEQVKKTPAVPALVFNEQTLTYLELNEQANRLGDYLKNTYQINPDDLIAIKLDRSIEMIVTILAVLKSGAAYVPIDPDYPQERINYILEDSQCKAVINDNELIKFKSISNSYSKENKKSKTKSNDLAYVIYTSGSTGKPKGSMVSHSNIVRLVKANEMIDLNRYNKCLSTGSMSFDASTFEIWGMLLNGGLLVITDKQTLLDSNKLELVIKDLEINIMWFTSSWFNNLVDTVRSVFSNLEVIIVGGEQLSLKHVKLARKYNPHLRIVNGYGPTECTTFSTFYEFSKELSEIKTVPIGKPIANTQIYILSNGQTLLPIGVAGEICIGGEGVSRGYLNNSELTQEKFIVNPFKKEEKIYRTGDLGRWLPDGNIEFIGRKDDQIKLRGYRIELGEIEKAMQGISGIDEAVVMTNVAGEKEKKLIAYIVSSISLNIAWLRLELNKVLPAYMLPSYYIQIDKLPLTSNGKIDKKALSKLKDGNMASGSEYVAPGNKAEEKLIEIWTDVLSIQKEKISINDNFFNLGGDSIKAIQVASRLKQENYSISVQDLLFEPTIKDLAKKMKSVIRVPDQDLVKGNIPLGAIQSWFLSHTHPGKNHFNQSVLLSSKEKISVNSLQNAIDKVVSHHDVLRMRYFNIEQGWIQENQGNELKCVVETMRYENKLNFELACEKAQSSFDLSKGPLLKVILFQNLEEDYLLIIAHHLIIDGVSWRVFLEDISNLYQQDLSGLELSLPLKTDSYAYWQEKIQKFSKSSLLAEEDVYWTAVDKLTVPSLPLDFKEGLNQYKTIRSCSFIIEEDATKLLLTKCGQAYQTNINDILIAALCLAFNEVFELSKLLIKMEGHGRENINEDVDITRTIGWFTTMYPVVFDLNQEDEIQQLINVKETLRKVPNNGIGYGILKYISGKKYEASPEIVFNYLGDFGTHIGAKQGGRIFEFSDKYTGKFIADDMIRDGLIDISGIVVADKLSLSINYSETQFHHHTIEKINTAYKKHLIYLIGVLSREEKKYLTPVDLTYKDLSISQIKQLNEKNNLEDVYRLSPLQQGMYYHWLVSQDSSLYFVQINCKIVGDLKIDVLKESFKVLLLQHPVLRTQFTQDFGTEVLQIVKKVTHPNFNYKNISNETGFSIDEFKREDRLRGFNLHDESQVRITILGTGNNEYEFIWSLHHIIIDGWCMGVLMKDFFQIYYDLCENKPPNLKKVQPYSVYINWLSKINKQKSLDYWNQYLSDYNVLISLPKISGIRNAVKEPKELGFVFESNIRESIQLFCKTIGITENTFIQGAWSILLSKYNNTKDVVFGAVVSGRPAELNGVEEMIGLFINTIPVRVKFSSDTTINELLKSIHYSSIKSTENHFIQLAQIQSESELGKNLFDHIMIFENYPVQDLITENINTNESEENKLSITSINVFEETNYDFTITIIPHDKLEIKYNYDGNLFDQQSIERVRDHFVRIIENILTQPDKTISALDYISTAEKQELLESFNATESSYPKERTLVDLFEEQVNNHPQSIALVFKEAGLTYKELNESANQLADYLKSNYHIQPDELIGIKLDRSIEMIVAILGILKSGGAYVPIDPDYPKERIDYILQDSNCKVLIDESELNKFNAVKNTYSKENKKSAAMPNHLAYVIYTSGSTGKPKGVMIDQESCFCRLEAEKEILKINRDTVTFLATNFVFDVSVLEIFLPLVNGGKIIIPSLDDLRSSEIVLSTLRVNKVNILQGTPGFISHVFSEISNHEGSLPELQQICIGGESLSGTLVNHLKEKIPHVRINNHYGPTETTIDSIVLKDIISFDVNLIGKPIANTKVYIVDDELNLLPKGTIGEICIGGNGLAKGYLNNPEFTKAKFINNPFIPGEKIYLTGDLGKWSNDGNIEFISRKDDQVKMRGYRIELGEIENVLKNHEEVSDAIVMLDKFHNENRLIAFVVQKPSQELEFWPSVGEYPVYDEYLYFSMTHDEKRNIKYKDTIRQKVKDKTVVDIGCGRNAILSRLCIEAGAKFVYSIEMDEQAFESATTTVKKLGLENKIKIILGNALEAELPEKVDVCISEIIGTIGSSEGAHIILKNAKKFLKSNGVMIPEKCITKVAAISLPEQYRNSPSFNQTTAYYANKVFDNVGHQFDIRVCIKNFDRSNIISTNDIVEDLNFNDLANFQKEKEFCIEISNNSKCDGLLFWINLYPGADNVIDSLKEETNWIPVYFPIFNSAIDVLKGDIIKGTYIINASNNGVNPDYKILGHIIRKEEQILDFDFDSYYNSKPKKESLFYNKLFNNKPAENNLNKIDITDKLSNYLAKVVPSYMIPTNYHIIKNVPLTPNGKVDKKSLLKEITFNNKVSAPVNTTEEKLLEIWSEVLGIEKEKISTDANFFDLGGNSIKILQMLQKVNSTFNKKILLTAIFGFTNIKKIAEHINNENVIDLNEFKSEVSDSINIMDNIIEIINQDENEE